jgi:hypothetical protein
MPVKFLNKKIAFILIYKTKTIQASAADVGELEA